MAEMSVEKHAERSVRIVLRVRGDDDDKMRRAGAGAGGGGGGKNTNTKRWWRDTNENDGSSRGNARRRRERRCEEGTMLRQGEESGEVLCDNYGVSTVAQGVDMKDENSNENGTSALRFRFSGVLWQNATQKDVFDECAELVDASLRGVRSACVLAYGQTGSGKTFTIFGENGRTPVDDDDSAGSPASSPNAMTSTRDSDDGLRTVADAHLCGIVPRTAERCGAILRAAAPETELSISMSLIEVYMDRLRDLLGDSSSASSSRRAGSLSIREAADGSTYVQGATSCTVNGAADIMHHIECGLTNRATAATKMNTASSRSHCILIFNVTGKCAMTKQRFKTHLYIVDLAGSEKVKQTGTSGSSLDEARSINSSLTALGKVVERLAQASSSQHDGDHAGDVTPTSPPAASALAAAAAATTTTSMAHIPYRDSKLTRLLQPALAGSSKTLLILCCSAARTNFSETVSTLRFGATMSAIKYKTVLSAGENMRERKLTELRNMQRQLDILHADRERIHKRMRNYLWRAYVPTQLALSALLCVACFVIFMS